MERVWTIVGLLWAIILIMFGLFILDSAIRAKVAEIRRDRSQKRMIKKLEQGFSKAIEKQVENMINGVNNQNAIDDFIDNYQKEMEKDNDE